MSSSNQKRPNFLLIVADDLGFSDVGCFGSEIRTPNIDKLASSGIRMTDFHTAAACSPTRAMLLSGTDNHIAGVGVMSEQKEHDLARWNVPGHEGYLNLRVAALPEVLQDNGYHTLLSGKWHLGLKPDYIPDKRGFDRSFALLPGCSNHYGWEPQFGDDMIKHFERIPPLYTEDGKLVDLKPNTDNDPNGFYSSDFYVDNLIKYLSERPTDQPFFAFLPFAAPHWPLQVERAYRDKYKGVYDDGPDALRQKRLARLKELGLIAQDVVPHEVVAPPESEWSSWTDKEKKLSARAMETFAGMVEKMDENIGKVLDYLERIGEADNTFIIFQSDNGAEGASYEAQPTLMGNSILDIIKKYYDNSLENIGEYNSFVWYGPRWAQAATAPSRLYKMYSTEGGIKVPMILKYPAWTKDRGGEVVNAFATVMDIMPTILDLAGIQHPGTVFRGREVEEMRGKSWVKFFENNHRKGDMTTAIHSHDDPAVGWELFGRAALRKGDWKIVYMTPWSYGKGEWELFDLSKDPGETRDLSSEEPQKLQELLELWDIYVKKNGVVWGSPVSEVEVKYPGLGRGDVIGGDPLEDTRAWMPHRGHCKD
ncbi:alkaline-phosphatase-like protein [Lentinula raphanica]|uniref:Alkaline-phosphatase-like protein n=1 Tax=Lentinula raphanica TaxID=153919 RepID=A0AA38PBG7_9AGAR|nr:alkaline-phosphatase-like protein [Lentinula raphanica]KAJ3839854.1 alkaline-phosphatase-like protein [Lentinula raphanica]